MDFPNNRALGVPWYLLGVFSKRLLVCLENIYIYIYIYVFVYRDMQVYMNTSKYIDVYTACVCLCVYDLHAFELFLCFVACRGFHSRVEHIHGRHTTGLGALTQLRCCRQMMIEHYKNWQLVPISISMVVSGPAVSHFTLQRFREWHIG